MLTESQILEFLRNPESDRSERTVSVSNIDKFCEAICAFSNDMANTGQKGYLFIGANDDGSIAGLQATDRLLRNLAALRTDGSILPQPALTVYKTSFPAGDIIVLEVTPYPPSHPPSYPPSYGSCVCNFRGSNTRCFTTDYWDKRPETLSNYVP